MFFCLDPVKHSFCRQEALEVLTQVRIANIDVNVSSSNAALQFWLSSHYHGVCLELIRANPLLWCDVHVSPLALSLDCVASPLSLSLSLSLSDFMQQTGDTRRHIPPTNCLTSVFVFLHFFPCEGHLSVWDTSLNKDEYSKHSRVWKWWNIWIWKKEFKKYAEDLSVRMKNSQRTSETGRASNTSVGRS